MTLSLKVVVLMGGPSAEHEISLKSGQGVLEALRRRGFSAEAVVVPQACSTVQACAFVTKELARLQPDVAFIALHGTFGEDGTIQQLCEECRVAYTGSDSAASRIGMDKAASRRRFEAAGLAVPKWQLINIAQGSRFKVQGEGVSLQPSTFNLELPVVVKPVREGSSLGVSLVRSPEEWGPALSAAGQYGDEVLIEEYIAGREVTVGILGEEPLPVVEIRPHHAFFDYTAKYTVGATEYVVPAVLPAELTVRVQTMAVAAHRAIGARHLSRADLLLREDQTPVLLEVNTIPGFTPTSLLPKAAACVGLSYDALCEQLVLMALPQHETTTSCVRRDA